MYISEFSSLAGVSIRTVHHYEEIGLIPPAKRRGKYRVFSETDLKRMEFIKRCKALGLSLKEVGELIHVFDQPAGERCKGTIKAVQQKKAEVVQELKTKQDQLKRLEQLEEQITDVINRYAMVDSDV